MKTLCIIASAAVLMLAGCSGEGITRPPPTTLYAFNAASNVESMSLLREENVEASMSYGDGAEVVFDSGQYDFHLDIRVPDSPAASRVYSLSQTLSPDLEHIFVAIAPGGQPEIMPFSIEPPTEGLDTVRWAIIHAFEGRGPLDVYVEAAGTDLTTATSRGTITFGAEPLVFNFNVAGPRLYLTTAGNPADVIFESTSQSLVPGSDEVIVVSDPGAQGTLEILVSRVRPNTVRFGQVGQTAQLRMVNVTEDRTARDVFLDDTAGTALFPALPFGSLTNYVSVEVTTHEIITTPVANPGTEEGSIAWFATPGRLTTVMVSGDAANGVVHSVAEEDKRSITGQGSLRLFNGATLFTAISLFVAEPGADITTIAPRMQIGAPAVAPRLGLLPGDYEITVTDALAATVLAGPLPVTLVDGGVYGVLLLNAAGGSTIDIVLFDDFITP